MSISDQVLDIFRETGALLQGHFILTSGRHSASYFQCAKVLQYPEHLQLFANDEVPEKLASIPILKPGSRSLK